MVTSTRLVDPSVARPDLHVRYRDEELADPCVTQIDLTYRGRQDIRSASFEQGQPFCIDLGVRIIELLETFFEPRESPVPKVETDGPALKVGPGLMRKGQTIKFVLLTDGPCLELTHENPLADIKVRQMVPRPITEELDPSRPSEGFTVKKVVTWALAIFIAYYLLTQPTAASHATHDLFNLLNQAGSSIATFLNSL
jgi:hypothetical protein